MNCYQIEGGRPLGGRLAVQGAKNSVLPILAAALLAPGRSVIHNLSLIHIFLIFLCVSAAESPRCAW